MKKRGRFLLVLLLFLIASNVYACADYNKYDKFIPGVNAEMNIQKIPQNMPKYRTSYLGEKLYLEDPITGAKTGLKREQLITRNIGGKPEPAKMLITDDNSFILLTKDGKRKFLGISKQEMEYYQVGVKDGKELSDIIINKFNKEGIQATKVIKDKYVRGVRVTKISISTKTGPSGVQEAIKDYIFVLDKGKLYSYTKGTIKDPEIINLLKEVGVTE